MKIKNSETSPELFPYTEFTNDQPICFLCGKRSDIALDLLRELIGSYDEQERINTCNDGCFVLYGAVEAEGKSYDICYIRNADGNGDSRIAVNCVPNSVRFSIEDTNEYIDRCGDKDIHARHMFKGAVFTNDRLLGAGDHLIKQFKQYLHTVKADTQSGDDRPVFLYHFFDRIDESVDITPFLNDLASLGRQVFVAVSANYPPERLIEKNVQIVQIDLAN